MSKFPLPILSLLVSGLVALSAARSDAQTTTLNLDFGTTGSPLATGYQSLSFGNPLATTPTVSFSLGMGVTLTFNNIGCYSTGNASQALTTDGFYNSIGATNSVFTLSGLPTGSTVSLYATDAWDGAGRAAFVSLGGSPQVDTANATQSPGNSPALSDFVLVAQNVAETGGAINGFFGPNGTQRAEGQIGGFIIQINQVSAVPEPSTYGLAAMVVLGGMTILRFRRKLA